MGGTRRPTRWSTILLLAVTALLAATGGPGAEDVPPPGPLPAMPVPAYNLQTAEKVQLGKMLFFDPRLSKGNGISCAFCHNPGTGWADARQFSVGVTGGQGGRQAPSVLNGGYQTTQFWDGRAGSLEEQALGSIQNPNEMAETLPNVVKKLNNLPDYKRRFRSVFGTEVTAEGMARAIAAFERTLISTEAPFDKYQAGDKTAMGESAVRGLALFTGKARCVLCHSGPTLTDERFHNLGVPQVGPLREDVGRYAVTRQEQDRGAFKTPTLRSVARTAPYMHDGVFKTLAEVVAFYDQGGGSNAHLDPLMQPLNLTAVEKQDLVEFLQALTGEPLPFVPPTLP